MSRLAATDGVELLDYNPDLVRIVDEKSASFEQSLKALEFLADQLNDPALVSRVEHAKARIRALEIAEADAREAERRAEFRAQAAELAVVAAEAKYGDERQRNSFLVAAASLDQDTILNLHHQIMIHAADVHHDVKRMMGRIRSRTQPNEAEWVDFLERVSYKNSQILTAARFATKGGYKQQSAEVEADLCLYIRDYIETISSLWAPRGVKVTIKDDGREVKRKFKPIEIGIIIDNLVSNAVKARSTHVLFELEVGKGAKPQLQIVVADDGHGWPKKLTPLAQAFEKGITTTDGSGLGLYHVKQIVEGLGGTIEALAEPQSEVLDGAAIAIRIPK